MVPVFIPANANSPLGTTEGTTIQVNQDTFFSVRRMTLQPTGGDIVHLAPYYYQTGVVWQNPDGSVMLVNGRWMTSTVYLAVVYDPAIHCWRDVSGIPSNRMWTYLTNYFVCSQSYSGHRFLQAFADGSSATSILYDQVQRGANNALNPWYLGSFELAVLNNPSLFFDAQGAAKVITTTAADYVLNKATSLDTCSFHTTGGVRAESDYLVTVGPSTRWYVSADEIYKVCHYPQTNTSDPVTVSQLFLTLPAQRTAEGGATPLPDIFSPSKQFVCDQISFQLAPYYLKFGGVFIALAPSNDPSIPAKNQFTTWAASADETAASIKADSTPGNILIHGYNYFDMSALTQTSLYLDRVPTPNNVTILFQPTDKTPLVLSRPTNRTSALIMVADAQFFQGQVLFCTNSLAKLQSLTANDIKQNPFLLYPMSVGVEAQREAEAAATNKSRKDSYAAAVAAATAANTPQPEKPTDPDVVAERNFIPITLTTPSATLNGLIALKTQYFDKNKDTSSYLAPAPYYQPIQSTEKLQLWYSTSPGVILQLANDLSSSLVQSITITPDTIANSWAGNLYASLKTAAQPFIGTAAPVMQTIIPKFWQRIAAVFKPSKDDYAQVTVPAGA